MSVGSGDERICVHVVWCLSDTSQSMSGLQKASVFSVDFDSESNLILIPLIRFAPGNLLVTPKGT